MVDNEDEGKALKEELRKHYERNAPPPHRRGRKPKKVRSSLDPDDHFDDISSPTEEDEEQLSEKSEEMRPPTSWEDWDTMSTTTSLSESSNVSPAGPSTPPQTPETEYTTESSLSHYVSSHTDPAIKTEEDPNATPETPTSPSSEPSEESDFKPDGRDFIPDIPHDENNPLEVPFAKGSWPPQWGRRDDSKKKKGKAIPTNFKPPAEEQAADDPSEVTNDEYRAIMLSTAPFFGTAVMKHAFDEYFAV